MRSGTVPKRIACERTTASCELRAASSQTQCSSCTMQEVSVEGSVLSHGSAEDGGGKLVMYGGERRSLGAMI